MIIFMLVWNWKKKSHSAVTATSAFVGFFFSHFGDAQHGKKKLLTGVTITGFAMMSGWFFSMTDTSLLVYSKL